MGRRGIVPAKREWLSYAVDIVLTATALILAVGGSHVIRWAEYVGGIRHDVGWGTSTSLALRPLIALIALILVLHAAAGFLRRSSTRRRMIASLAFSAIAVFATCTPVREPAPLAPVFLKGLARGISKDMDIAAIQQWLATEARAYAGQSYRFEFPDELPKCMVAFKPMCIRFNTPVPEEGMTVEFSWDTGHGEYHSLVVGPPTMEMPKTEMVGLPNGENEFRQTIGPGAYVFCRG